MAKDSTLKLRGVRLDDEHHLLLNYLKGSRNRTQTDIIQDALRAFATEEELYMAKKIYQESLEREAREKEGKI